MSKITGYTELSAAPASGDYIPIVDVDDTTQSANGTTKKITSANLLSSAGGGGWSLVEYGTFTTTKSITGLAGNTALVYKLIFRINNTSGIQPTMTFNSDTASNYVVNHQSSGWNSSANVDTNVNEDTTAIKLARAYAHEDHFVEMLIHAASGKERRFHFTNSALTDGTTFLQVRAAGHWQDTSNELTSIQITTGAITGGEYWLYKIVSA